MKALKNVWKAGRTRWPPWDGNPPKTAPTTKKKSQKDISVDSEEENPEDEKPPDNDPIDDVSDNVLGWIGGKCGHL